MVAGIYGRGTSAPQGPLLKQQRPRPTIGIGRPREAIEFEDVFSPRGPDLALPHESFKPTPGLRSLLGFAFVGQDDLPPVPIISGASLCVPFPSNMEPRVIQTSSWADPGVASCTRTVSYTDFEAHNAVRDVNPGVRIIWSGTWTSMAASSNGRYDSPRSPGPNE
jgi:hypothetical protein